MAGRFQGYSGVFWNKWNSLERIEFIGILYHFIASAL